jgi:predicted ATPase/DNA-binding CsgD family transcriptional regulator
MTLGPIDAATPELINLPVPPGPLVGREHELGSAGELLRGEARLLTVTGPAGVGKTRLAVEIAWQHAREFADGVCFVALAPVVDPDLVAATIAESLGVSLFGSRSPLDLLKGRLRYQEILIVLDNFEHVAEAAPMLAEILATCPGPRLLVTSRVLLRLSGEVQFPVMPLAYPETAFRLDPTSAEEFPALRLFAERARAAAGSFTLDDANAGTVAAICARLDGLPLAIELAAARIRHLSPTALLTRLEPRLPLLTGGPRDLPARLRTMRDAIGWSHDLLGPDHQVFFRQLAVFSGGWTLDAAAAVGTTPASPEPEVLETMASLVDGSLVQARPSARDSEPRYAMLETVREYALEQLAGSGEGDTARRAHRAFFLDLAEKANRELGGPQQAIWLGRLTAEHDNMRAALASAIDDGDADTALRLGTALWRYWAQRGQLIEGRSWLERALAMGGNSTPAVRGGALHCLGNLALDLDDYRLAADCYQQGLEIWRRLSDDDGIAGELTGLGLIAHSVGDYGRARQHFNECLGIWRTLGATAKVAVTLHNLGNLATQEGLYEQGRAHHEEALALRQEIGDADGVAYSLLGLATVSLHVGDVAGAASWYAQSRSLFAELGDFQGEAYALVGLGHVNEQRGDDQGAGEYYGKALRLRHEFQDRLGIAECLEGLAGVSSRRGRAERSARLLGSAASLREGLGAFLGVADRSVRERLLATVRRKAGSDAFGRAFAAGHLLPIERAVAEGLAVAAEAESVPAAIVPLGLTPREVEVLRLLARRLTDPEIAEALYVSTRTASNHVANIRHKLGVANRRQAADFATQYGLG